MLCVPIASPCSGGHARTCMTNTASSQGMWLIYSCHLLSILNAHTSFHVAPYLTAHSYSLCDIYGLWWDHTFLGKWIHLRPSHWAVSGSSALQTSSATVSSTWQAERLADQAAFAFLLNMKKKKNVLVSHKCCWQYISLKKSSQKSSESCSLNFLADPPDFLLLLLVMIYCLHE